MIERTEVPERFMKRLAAMVKRSKDYQKQFSTDKQIYQLLDSFIEFSNDYIKLLKKAPSDVYRYPFVVNRGIERLLQEWNILSRASEQLLIAGFTDEIARASGIAQGYCDKWNAILPDNTDYKLKPPVIYFEKMFRISRSIYAPEIPVISIPLTDFNEGDSWLALAHEFSHHIFWNGFGVEHIREAHRQLRESLSSKLPAERAVLWKNWLDEVFADAFGTLLAGSDYALSAQDRLEEQLSVTNDFTIADHKHPCIYLRPLVSLQVLDVITAKVGGEGEVPLKLRDRWKMFSKQAERLEYRDIPLAALEEDIEYVVSVLLNGKVWPIKFDPVKMLADPVKLTKEIPPLTPIIDHDPRSLSIPELKEISLPSVFEGIKQHLVETSNRIIQGLRTDKSDQDSKLTAWSLLLELALSETGDYHVHGCAPRGDHYHNFWSSLWAGHTHGEAGTDLRPCDPG